MENIIVGLILIVIVAIAAFKIYKDKKNNVICSGCDLCSSKANCNGYKKSDQQGLL